MMNYGLDGEQKDALEQAMECMKEKMHEVKESSEAPREALQNLAKYKKGSPTMMRLISSYEEELVELEIKADNLRKGIDEIEKMLGVTEKK